MKIIDKINEKAKNIYVNQNVTIAFLGDSVTQGCFELYKTAPEGVQTVFDIPSAYHSKLREIFSVLYPNVPMNIINAGVSGGSAPGGYERLQRDVLRYSPDLVVVCFGLNDCGQGIEKLADYTNALSDIFDECTASGAEVLFMTPNTMCGYAAEKITDSHVRGIAQRTAQNYNAGTLDKYVDAAKALCAKKNVPVCDCYAKWKLLEKNGADTTLLLANNINHPLRDMHWLFAYSLVEALFEN